MKCSGSVESQSLWKSRWSMRLCMLIPMVIHTIGGSYGKTSRTHCTVSLLGRGFSRYLFILKYGPTILGHIGSCIVSTWSKACCVTSAPLDMDTESLRTMLVC